MTSAAEARHSRSVVTQDPMSRPVLPSLRTELLIPFAILALAAVAFAVSAGLLLFRMLAQAEGVLYLTLLITADVAVVLGIAALRLRRLVLRPVQETAAAAAQIADGDLRHRVAPQSSRELDELANSMNRMTDRLVHEQAQLVRDAKLSSAGGLAAGVAHQIEQPLRALNEYAERLRASSAHDRQAMDALAGLEREAAQLDAIVRELLTYGRLRRPTTTPVEINAVLRRVVDRLTAQGAMRRVSLQMQLANESPRVIGDPQELERLFTNLLQNAADVVNGSGAVAIRTLCIRSESLEVEPVRRAGDAAPAYFHHAPNPRTQQWLEREGRPDWTVKIVVADSGPAISEEDAERIFDPFHVASQPGQPVRGSGLSHSIVARIVDDLEGLVWVQRAREGGAAFHILLPVAGAAYPLDGPRAASIGWHA